ncbi:MAG: methionine gamma-lyase family protein [Oscillospiraceae bacterium]|jgi:cystathionine beta-lyase family protein involved in aluminum resistance|nr:methionine gamma-lyase family protein [Oscillospiraceae bacterium]
MSTVCDLAALTARAEEALVPAFAAFDRIALENTRKVLAAFQRHRVSDSHFAPSTGYGYNDPGRETLDAVFADLMGTEDALVRTSFASGTHAIGCALRAAAPQGGYLSLTGEPYDTLQGLLPYTAQTGAARQTEQPAALFIQRSRGYTSRKALSVAEVNALIAEARTWCNAPVVVDNCYCEFVETEEPCAADLIAGSLIKNPGGGLAPCGGYVAGRRNLVEKAAVALNGVGRDCGANPDGSRLLFQGLFLAPHTVAQALKTAAFASYILRELGYAVSPRPEEARSDIIQSVAFGSPEPLLRFCRGIQAGSPVDSFAAPEPWDMPGYGDPVVMAAGTFIQGASIELSCDAPIREPYTAYLQGGLTYEAGKLGILTALETLQCGF